MKVAIVHDYIKEYGGAERVLEALHEVWPNAPVYTLVYLPEFLGPHQKRFGEGEGLGLGKWNIKTSILQYLPFKTKMISPFRLIASFIFSLFDFNDYDVVIVSATGAYIPNSIRIKNSIHICYCHTPPRYLYGFATARDWKKNPVFRVLGGVVNHFLRILDFKAAQNVDYFIANSKNTGRRIWKFYRRESVVIYPPVNTLALRSLRQFVNSSKVPSVKNLSHAKAPRALGFKYYLCGGRLARPKHMDLIIQTCQELNLPLKVFGKGFAGYDEELRVMNQELRIKNNQNSVEFLGEVNDEEKYELMRNAKAYIFASEDEDFGITPVEAMARGIPVIAYRSGGVLESVIEGKTGVFFNELTIKSLSKAIAQFNNLTISSVDCINQAQKFSKERFKKEIKEFIEGVFQG